MKPTDDLLREAMVLLVTWKAKEILPEMFPDLIKRTDTLLVDISQLMC